MTVSRSKHLRVFRTLLAICLVILMIPFQSLFTLADNPIVQTTYTADPAPMVYNDTVYIYTGQDLDHATTSYRMTDYKCYSSTDMVNWTDHGTVLDVSAFSWARHDQDANAAQVIYNPKTDKFYYFVSVSCTLPNRGGIAVGVAVSDSPTGPFVDAIGEPLVSNDMTKYASHSWDDLDPSVFIDDDGQAYLVWGNGACYWAKLSDDMTSLTSEISWFDITDQSQFGPSFTEAPWIYKRGDLYYLVYASKFPETISYSTSDSPTGPWTFRGEIMGREGSNCSTIHPGIIDYKGNSYFVYHKNGLPGGGDYKRAVCIEKFTYNDDGTIPFMPMTDDGGIEILENVNPYTRNEAETMAWSYPLLGISTEECSQGGLNIASIDDGDYIKVAGVDFGDTGAATYTASVASGSEGGAIELRLDSEDGTLIGTLDVPYTGSDDNWKTVTTTVSSEATGIHDLYFVFKGADTENLFKVDYWQFGEKTEEHNLAAINASVDKIKIDKIDGLNKANLTVTAIYTDGTSEDITSQVDIIPELENIVSVADGIVTGIGYGETSVTVSYQGYSDTFEIIVKDLVAELTVKNLTFNPTTISVSQNASQNFTVTATYVDGHTEDVTQLATYESSNPEICTVENGVVHGINSGTVNITASFAGEMGDPVTATMEVRVLTYKTILNHTMATVDEYNAVVDGYINRVPGRDETRKPSYDASSQSMVYLTEGLWTSSGFKYDITSLVSEYPVGTEFKLSMDVKPGASPVYIGFLYDNDTNGTAGEAFNVPTNEFTNISTLVTLKDYSDKVYLYTYCGNPTISAKNINLMVSVPDDKPEIGIELEKETYYQNEIFTVKATYPEEYTDIRFTNEYGSSIGTSLIDAVDNGNGTYTWTIALAIGTKGDRTINVMNGSEKIGEFNVTILGGDKPQYPDESANIVSVKSAKVAWANDNFNVKVVTRRGASDVKLFNEFGNEFGKTLVSKEIVGNTIEWEFSMNIGSKGLRTITVKSIDAVGNINDSESFTMAIV